MAPKPARTNCRSRQAGLLQSLNRSRAYSAVASQIVQVQRGVPRRLCRLIPLHGLWQDFPVGMALFRAVTAYTEITRVYDDCSLAVAFTFMIACSSSKCQGQKSCESTPTSIDSDSGSSGKLPWE